MMSTQALLVRCVAVVLVFVPAFSAQAVADCEEGVHHANCTVCLDNGKCQAPNGGANGYGVDPWGKVKEWRSYANMKFMDSPGKPVLQAHPALWRGQPTQYLWYIRVQDSEKVCQFPFKYEGKDHWACLLRGYKEPWCGTVRDVDEDPESWGFCAPLSPVFTSDFFRDTDVYRMAPIETDIPMISADTGFVDSENALFPNQQKSTASGETFCASYFIPWALVAHRDDVGYFEGEAQGWSYPKNYFQPQMLDMTCERENWCSLTFDAKFASSYAQELYGVAQSAVWGNCGERVTVAAPAASSIGTYGGNAETQNCVFPFKFGDVEYSECIADPCNKYMGDGCDGVKAWCATTADFDTSAVWGYCQPDECTAENCNVCETGGTCYECSDGYNLNADGGCYPCNVEGCRVCAESDADTCIECDEFHRSRSGSCERLKKFEGCEDGFGINPRQWIAKIGWKLWECSEWYEWRNLAYLIEEDKGLPDKVIPWLYQQTISGDVCHLPFLFNGKNHSSCVTFGSAEPWCGTVSDVDEDSQGWDYCAPVDIGVRETPVYAIPQETNVPVTAWTEGVITPLGGFCVSHYSNGNFGSIPKTESCDDHGGVSCSTFFDYQGWAGQNAMPKALDLPNPHGNTRGQHAWGRCQDPVDPSNYTIPEGSSVSDIITFGGNADSAKCVFPFTFKGEQYEECISDPCNTFMQCDGKRVWCSTTGDYDQTGVWGYCPKPCPDRCDVCVEDGSGTCEECEAGLGLTLDGEACTECEVACLTCSAFNHCTNCSDDKTLTADGNCTCTSEEMVLSEEGLCVCPADKVLSEDGLCVCPADKILSDGGLCVCSADKVLSEEGLCVCPANKVLNEEGLCVCSADKVLSEEGICVCSVDKVISEDGLCVCPADKVLSEDGLCMCPADKVLSDDGLCVYTELPVITEAPIPDPGVPATEAPVPYNPIHGVKTTGGNSGGSGCVFPFKYNGALYKACTRVDHGQPWCSTTPDYDTDKKWGNCVIDDGRNPADIPSWGGNGHNGICYFNFIFEGKSYSQCTTDGHTKPWCATTANFDTHGLWGFCGEDPTPPAAGAGGDHIAPNSGNGSNIPTSGGNGGGQNCELPFKYNNVMYDACTDVDHGQPWCSITSDYDMSGMWGNCIIDGESSFGGNDAQSLCHFPFIFQSNLYQDCTMDQHDRAWCATTADYDSDQKWKYCGEDNSPPGSGVNPGSQIHPGTGGDGECVCPQNPLYPLPNPTTLVCPAALPSSHGNGNGANCVFPFTYDGKQFTECVPGAAPHTLGAAPNANGLPWCSVTSDFEKNGLWGYCGAPAPSCSMTRHELRHALGASPYLMITCLEDCLAECMRDNQCVAIDWNFTPSPFMGAQCWHHTNPHDGVIPNDSADHYTKDCMGN